MTSLLVLILKGEHSKIKRKHQLEQLRLKQEQAQEQKQQDEDTKLVGETPSENEKLNPYKPTIEVTTHHHHPGHEVPRPSFRQIVKTYRLIFSILFLKPILKLIVIFLTVRVR